MGPINQHQADEDEGCWTLEDEYIDDEEGGIARKLVLYDEPTYSEYPKEGLYAIGEGEQEEDEKGRWKTPYYPDGMSTYIRGDRGEIIAEAHSKHIGAWSIPEPGEDETKEESTVAEACIEDPDDFIQWGRMMIEREDSENTPGQSNTGIEKPKHRSDNGLGWDNLGFHGSPESESGSQTPEQDQIDSDRRLLRKVTDGGLVCAASHDTLPSGITPQTPLTLTERTEEEVRAILVGLNLGPDPEPKAEHIKTTEREEYLAKRDAITLQAAPWRAYPGLVSSRANAIPRKKAWSWELRQALGKKSKLEVAQWLVFCLFGEKGYGGSVDFMKTGDMVAKVMGSDLYLKWRIETGDDISRNTIERALGRRA